MAITKGNRTITEYDINASITSSDKHLNINSGGKGVATIGMTVDRSAPGVLGAINILPLKLTFPACVPESVSLTDKFAVKEQPRIVLSTVSGLAVTTLDIDKVPGFPYDMTNELFDVNVLDNMHNPMVATLTSTGGLVGDIDTSASIYNNSTGALHIVWNRPLLQGGTCTFIRRTVSPVSSTPFQLSDVIPYSTVKHYVLSIPVVDAGLNQKTPIAPKSVKITVHDAHGGKLTVTDDGEGALIGDVDSTKPNHINYQTGDVSVTFKDDLWEGHDIVAEYSSLVLVKEIVKPSSKPVCITVQLDWNDLARIVRSVEQMANSAETELKYRANT